MPQVELIKIKNTKRVDVSAFLKEEAFITIKRMNKYKFTYLLNKGREGYSSTIYGRVHELEIVEGRKATDLEYNKIRDEITPDEMKAMFEVDERVYLEYFNESIVPDDGHNFTSVKSNELIHLTGTFFWESYGELRNDDGLSLASYLTSEIIQFNSDGLTLGE